MSGTGGGRVVRSYTSARQHGYKVGKFGDWTVPFGPYSPAQLIVMVAGAVLLIRTFSVWKFAGPLPIMAWIVAVWAVRGTTIRGRSPLAAAWGWVCLLLQPRQGRIAGRIARRPRPAMFSPAFTVAVLPPVLDEAIVPPAPQGPSAPAQPVVVPSTGLGRLLAAAAQSSGTEES